MSSNNGELSALLSSTVLIIVGIILSSISSLLERVIIARWFNPEAYGEVAIGLSILGLGTTISLMGFNQGIPRFLSRFDDERDIRGMWLTGQVVAVSVSSIMSIGLLVNIDWLTSSLLDSASSTALLRLFILAIPLNVSLTVGISTIRGLENTRYKILTNDLVRPSLQILIIVLLLVTGSGILAVGYAYVATAAVTLVVAHLFANRLVSLIGPVRTRLRELMVFSAPLIVTMMLSALLTQTDTLMLGYFRTTGEVGLYNAAYPLSQSLLLVVSAFGYMYLPLTSRLDSKGRRDDVGEIYRTTTKWGYIITFPAFLVFVTYPGDILSMFFGSEYASAGIVLAILSIGFFTRAAAGHNKDTLAALGDTRTILVAEIFTVGFNLVANLLLIPVYGITGAAIASAIAYGVRNVTISGILWRKFGITPFSRRTVATYVVLPVLFVPAAFALSNYVTLSLVTLPAFLVVTGIAGIVVVALAGGLQAEDQIVLDLLENTIGVEVPYIREYLLAVGVDE